MLSNHTKGHFDLIRAFFNDWDDGFPVKFAVIEWRHINFYLMYWQLTFMSHYRIQGFLAGGILNSEAVSKLRLYLRVIKSKL